MVVRDASVCSIIQIPSLLVPPTETSASTSLLYIVAASLYAQMSEESAKKRMRTDVVLTPSEETSSSLTVYESDSGSPVFVLNGRNVEEAVWRRSNLLVDMAQDCMAQDCSHSSVTFPFPPQAALVWIELDTSAAVQPEKLCQILEVASFLADRHSITLVSSSLVSIIRTRLLAALDAQSLPVPGVYRWEAVESVSSLLQHLPGDVVTRIVEFFHIYDVLNAPLFLLRARLRLHCEQSSNLDLSCENIGTHHAWVTCMQRLLSEAASFEFHSLRMPAIASATCEGFEGLLGTLRAGIWPSLTALDLQECEVNYDHARGLADAVKSFPGLAAITLPELKDGSTQWPGQATFTVAGALCSLSALYSVVIPVSKCTSGVATLCQELGSGCNRLTRLEFDPLVCGIGEPLDAYRLSTVTANLLMQGVVAFSASLRVLKLPLSASKKGPHFPSGMHSDVHVLCNHVSNLTALTYLDVVYDAYEWRNSCPTFGNRLLCMLSTLVDQLRSLRVLRFVCQNIQFCPSDTSVDDHMPLVRESFERLEEVDIRGEDGDLLFPLSRLLQGVEAIKSVHVIDQENAETLGGVIRDSNSHCVENLHLLSSLKELNLEMSSDFPVSCRNSLAESVGKLSHLRKLCIRQRCFWPNASESLLAKVASMSELQQLQYSCYGGNGDTECKSLADEVEYLQNTVAASLTSLDVRRVDRVGFHHIMVVCRHLSMLRSLKLESFPNELPHACRVALLLRDVPLLNCVDLCVSVACEDVPVEVGREVHQSSEVEKKGVEQRAGSLQAADVLGRALGRLTELTRLSLKLDLGRDQALTPVGEMGSHLTSLCKLRTISMRVSTRSCLGVAYDVRNAGQLLRPHVAGLCVPVHEL